jgi:hypothetical protein
MSFLLRLAIPLGVIMLVVWGIATVMLEAPGWVHGLLTVGVFLVIWGIVARGAPDPSERS